MTATSSRINTFFLGVLALVATGLVLYVLRDLAMSVIIALGLSLIFKPILLAMRRRGIPLPLAVLIIILIVLAIFVLLGLILFNGAQSVVEAAPRYQERLNKIVQEISLLAETSLRKAHLYRGRPLNPADAIQLSTITGLLGSMAGSFLSVLENVVLIMLFLVFMLSGSESFQLKLGSAFASHRSARLNAIIVEVNAQVRRYLVVKTLISFVVGTLTSVVLLLFDVDFPFLIGALTFFLNFIPNFGALIATMFPALVALLQFGSLGLALLITALLIVMHNVVGNLVEPRVLGTQLDLSPLLVLISLIFWGWLWGFIGMFLAVPITSMIKIMCENIDELKPIAVLMSTGPRK